MNQRIKTLRKKLGLSQEQFSQKIGMARNSIANYEIGRREPSNAIITSICREFSVNENWLRNGDGEMFLETDNSLIGTLQEKYNLDNLDIKIIETFIKLDDYQRKIIKNYILSVAEGEKADRKVEDGDSTVVYRVARSNDGQPPIAERKSREWVERLDNLPDSDDEDL